MTRDHTHDIEEVYWPGRPGWPGPGHVHGYSTPTSFNDGHRHIVRGTTSTPYGQGPNHIHYYQGETTFNDGHTHRFSGWTGPAIPLPGGGHYHVIAGRTTYDDGHVHSYRGRTGRNQRW